MRCLIGYDDYIRNSKDLPLYGDKIDLGSLINSLYTKLKPGTYKQAELRAMSTYPLITRSNPITPFYVDSSTSSRWAEVVSKEYPITIVSETTILSRFQYTQRPSKQILSEIMSWIATNQFTLSSLKLPVDYTLMIDFHLIGGTFTYRSFLEIFNTARPIFRVVGFSGFYLLIHKGMINPVLYTAPEIMREIKQRCPRILFVNHFLDIELNFLLECLRLDCIKIAPLHDCHYISPSYGKLLYLFDYVISQSKLVSKLYSIHASKMIFSPHPDYCYSQPVSIMPPGVFTIGMIGAISPVKGSDQLRVILEAGFKVNVYGIVPPDFPKNERLSVYPYNNLTDLNLNLITHPCSVLWYHNDISIAPETWCYAFTLGILTKLPLVCNRSPVFEERAPEGVYFYDTSPVDIFRQLQSNPPLYNFHKILPYINYPLIFPKIFQYDESLVKFGYLNTDVNLSGRQLFDYYLRDENHYFPCIGEMNPSVYFQYNADLPTKVSELCKHFVDYGKKEGRIINEYKKLSLESIREIVDIYADLDTKVYVNYPMGTEMAAIMFETRKSKLVKIVLRNLIHYGKGHLHVYLIVTPDIMEWYRQELENYNITLIEWNFPLPFTIDNYNVMMKNPKFWALFEEEHILTFQTDAFLFNDIPYERLIKGSYPFVGAFHYHSIFGDFDINTPKKQGMNGGLSYRRKSTILELLSFKDADINQYRSQGRYPPFRTEIPEDAFFYHGLEMKGLPFPSSDYCDSLFLQNRIYKGTSFGYHGMFYGEVDMKDVRRLIKENT